MRHRKHKVGTNNKDGQTEMLKNNKLTIQLDANNLYIFEKGSITAILPLPDVTRGTKTYEWKKILLIGLGKYIESCRKSVAVEIQVREEKRRSEEERIYFQDLRDGNIES